MYFASDTLNYQDAIFELELRTCGSRAALVPQRFVFGLERLGNAVRALLQSCNCFAGAAKVCVLRVCRIAGTLAFDLPN